MVRCVYIHTVTCIYMERVELWQTAGGVARPQLHHISLRNLVLVSDIDDNNIYYLYSFLVQQAEEPA